MISLKRFLIVLAASLVMPKLKPVERVAPRQYGTMHYPQDIY